MTSSWSPRAAIISGVCSPAGPPRPPPPPPPPAGAVDFGVRAFGSAPFGEERANQIQVAHLRRQVQRRVARAIAQVDVSAALEQRQRGRRVLVLHRHDHGFGARLQRRRSDWRPRASSVLIDATSSLIVAKTSGVKPVLDAALTVRAHLDQPGDDVAVAFGGGPHQRGLTAARLRRRSDRRRAEPGGARRRGCRRPPQSWPPFPRSIAPRARCRPRPANAGRAPRRRWRRPASPAFRRIRQRYSHWRRRRATPPPSAVRRGGPPRPARSRHRAVRHSRPPWP